MKLKLYFFAILALSASLSAQSVTLANISNLPLTWNAVVGDNTRATITGATPGALVTLSYTQNGIPGQWNAGYIQSDGTWTFTETQNISKAGAWEEQWEVGGVNVGPLMTFDIWDNPTSLSLVRTTASSPNTCGSSYRNFSILPYGPSANNEYEIRGSTGARLTVRTRYPRSF